MTKPFDVIVIGTGPAGSTAAYRLARAGHKTLLLEKEKLPRYKPCGGGLTTRALEAVDFDLAPMLEDSIARLAFAYDHQIKVDLDCPKPMAWCVMRDRFDNYLAERAALAGAELHDGEPVREIVYEPDRAVVKTATGEYATEIVVGADGATGITARSAGLNKSRNLAAALEAEIEVSPAQLETWRGAFYIDFAAVPYGYAWIFPKRDHLSVGVGTLVSGDLFPKFAKGAGGRSSNLRGLLKQWVEGEPTLRGGRERLSRGHLLPLGGRAAPLHAPRVVLTGDAAGLIDPFTGEGISFAMRSGQIAAEVIAEAFRREDLDLSSYTERVQAEFLPGFQNAASLTHLFYRYPRVCLSVVSRSRRLQAAIAGAAEGNGYTGLAWRAARRVGRLMARA